MHLLEMIGYKKYQNMTLPEILSTIVQDNFGEIHSGEFGFVLDTGKDFVYKCWFNDSAYEQFIKYCIQHQSNQHLPKILSNKIITIPIFFKRKAGIYGKLKVIKIEKLIEKRFTLYDNDEPIGLSWLNRTINNKDTSSSLFDNHWFGEDNELISTLLEVIDNLTGVNCDLGQSNIMFRGNVKVLTDPVNPIGWRKNKIIRMPHLLDKDTTTSPENVAPNMQVIGKGHGNILHTKIVNPSVSELTNIAMNCDGSEVAEKQIYELYKHDMFELFKEVDESDETYDELYYVFSIMRQHYKNDLPQLIATYNNK